MSISFNAMPINLRTPGAYVEIDNSQAVRGLGILPAKIVMFGQKLAAGSSPALKATRITSYKQAVQLYGAGSQISAMFGKMKAANDFVEVWGVPLVDLAAGVAATGSITFTGPATAAGVLAVYVGGRLVRAGIATGQTAAQTATALVAAMGKADLRVTAAIDGANTAKVNLTARNKGVCGNSIDIRINYFEGDTLPAGLAAVVTAMAGGAGNPDLTPAMDALRDEWFTDWVSPYADGANMAALKAELASRFGPLRQIDAHAYVGAVATHAALSALGESHNSPHVSILGLEPSPTPPDEIAAVLAATCAFALANDPARPVQTLTLTGVMAPAIADRFTRNERNLLLYSGISTATVDAGGTVVIERVVTTYRETVTGLDDPSFLNIETVKTLTFLRYDTRTFFWRKYPRHKLANDGTRFGAGQAVMTPKLAKAELVARFELWEEAGLVENADQFKRDLIVERNGSDPDRLDALIPPDVINQLRVFAGLIQFKL